MPIDEEPLDRFLNRPLAKLSVVVLQPTPVTANQVSVFAGFLGVLAGIAMGLGSAPWLVAAALLLWGQLIFDCADGELARKRGGGGRSGQIVDGLADYVVAISIHVGLWVLLERSWAFRSVPSWAIAIVVILSGASMAIHSAVFDAAKQAFRVGIGKSAAWTFDREALRREREAAAAWKERFFLRVFGWYASSQETFSKWVHGTPTQGGFLAWSLLGPTFRVTLLAVVLVASIWFPRAVALYPIYGVGVANAILVVLMLGAGMREAPGIRQQASAEGNRG